MRAEERKCPQCKHAAAGRMVRCLYCGADLDVGPGSGINRRCARCSKDMQVVNVGWVAIDRCAGCGGEFYDAGEIHRAVKMDDAKGRWLERTVLPRPHDTPGQNALVCPGCATPMKTMLVPARLDLLIDMCGGCKGVWLDKGEAQRLKLAADESQESVCLSEVQVEADRFANDVNCSVNHDHTGDSSLGTSAQNDFNRPSPRRHRRTGSSSGQAPDKADVVLFSLYFLWDFFSD